MGATKRLANLEVFSSAPSDRCASTASLRSKQCNSCDHAAGPLLRNISAAATVAVKSPLLGGFFGNTPPGWLDQPRWPPHLIESSASVLWLNQVTQWFCGEPHLTLRTWCSLPPISTHDLAPTSNRLDLGFEARQWNRPRLRLAIFATMWPTLDPAGHRVPQTKPTCLLHTWRPHRHRPSALVLHLHHHQSSRNLHCNT
jgi:hypothetical protein